MRAIRRIALAAAILVSASWAWAPRAWAQGKFSAWNQGNLYLFNKVGQAEPTYGWGPDWNNTTGIDQEWTFSYSGKEYGFSGTIEFGMSDFTNNASLYDLGWFETYYKFGKLASLHLGRLRMADFTLGTAIEGARPFAPFADKQFGAALKATPVQGLSLGLFVQVPTSGVFAKTFNGGSWQQIATAASIDYLGNLCAGAALALPGFGTVVAQYSSIADKASLGCRTTVLGKVFLVAGYEAGLADLSAPTHKALASAGASLGPVSLNADFSAALSASGFAFGGEAQVEWSSGPYALGLLAGYDDGKGASLFNQGCGSWDGIEVYPYVARNYDNGSSVKLGLVYASGANGHQSLISAPLVYVWCF